MLEVRIKIMLRPTVIRPACLGCKHPPGAYDQIFVTVRQLRVSLTREWVCRLQLLLVLASAVILESESRGTRDHILLPHSGYLKPGSPGPRIYNI
jgi:hypothetical protein